MVNMKYLCLVYFEEKTLDALSSAEFESLRREGLAHMDELERRGNLVVANALQRTRMATSLRLRNGKISITDGPFAETKEQLGGFMLLEARDLSEAVQLAGTSPMARLGSVEVRPTWELEQKEPSAGRALPAKGDAGAVQ
jgi:hypothetical protein